MRPRLPVPQAFAVGGHAFALRDALPADASGVLALHRDVFGSEVDTAWFDWKYRQGQGESVGVWHGDALVAHCGGVPRKLWHQGRAYRGLQIGDVMVQSQWRGLLTRSGPFFRVSQAFYDSRLAATAAAPADTPAFGPGFGFPNARHLRLGMKVGLLRDAGPVLGLDWTAQEAQVPASWRLHKMALQGLGALVLRTAAAVMRRQLRSFWLADRSLAYLAWRYLRRPGFEYEVWQVQSDARPWRWGVAVTRGGSAQTGAMQWLDWIGPVEAMPVAVALLRAACARRGAPGLSAWGSMPVLEHLRESGLAQVQEVARIGVPACSPLAGLASRDNGWWLMGGDTDFL